MMRGQSCLWNEVSGIIDIIPHWPARCICVCGVLQFSVVAYNSVRHVNFRSSCTSEVIPFNLESLSVHTSSASSEAAPESGDGLHMFKRCCRLGAQRVEEWKPLWAAFQHLADRQSSSAAASTSSPRKVAFERRLRRSFMEDETKPEDSRPIYAGVILERYPICFPEPRRWKLEHETWRMQWNSWKYRQVTDEQMSADKQNVDEESAEVRDFD
jgi:hypothetical protein